MAPCFCLAGLVSEGRFPGLVGRDVLQPGDGSDVLQPMEGGKDVDGRDEAMLSRAWRFCFLPGEVSITKRFQENHWVSLNSAVTVDLEFMNI